MNQAWDSNEKAKDNDENNGRLCMAQKLAKSNR